MWRLLSKSTITKATSIRNLGTRETRPKITIYTNRQDKENGETINAYEYQDFSVDNFLFIPKGTVTLEFKPNVSKPPKCVITMMEGYLSN